MAILSVESIASTFSGLQSELEALKSIGAGAALDRAVVELKEKILGAREAQLAALQRISELEKNVMAFEDWEAEKKRYLPQQFDPGVIVYVLKPEMAAGEPLHHACPNCYANRKVRILQGTHETHSRRQVRICMECDKKLAYGTQGPLPQTRIRGSWMSN
ncbi:MAG: hypothetical protein LCH88_16775 [Proteobacteria bacterium]|nr:hypothetical protein [Pseudomonadota bacterium]MCA0319715.1 hypothetical protein [Pseudomonadota bacterium]